MPQTSSKNSTKSNSMVQKPFWIQRRVWFWTLLLGLYGLLRLPGLFMPHWSLDEGFYLAIGSDLNFGQELYSQTWDHKPPLIYWLYAIFLRLSNNQYFIFPLLNFIFGLISIYLVFQIATIYISSKFRYLTPLLFGLILSIGQIETIIFNAENIFVPLTLAGILLFRKQTPIYLLLAGTCFLLASLVKIHPAIEIIGFLFGWFIISTGSITQRLRALIITAIPVVFGWAGVFWYLYHHGNLEFGIFSMFLYNSDYIEYQSSRSASFLGLPLYDPMFAKYWLSHLQWRFLVLIGSTALLSFTILKGKFQDFRLQLVFWGLWSGFAVLLAGREYSHYLIQILPIFAISLAVFFDLIFTHWPSSLHLPKSWFAPLTALITWVLLWQYFIFIFSYSVPQLSLDNVPLGTYLGFYPKVVSGNLRGWQDDILQTKLSGYPVKELALAVQKRTAPNERIWNYTNLPALPYYAQRNSGYVTKSWFHITGQLEEKTLQELEKQPPKLIVWDTTVPQKERILKFVQARYRLDETLSDTNQIPRFQIWVLV